MTEDTICAPATPPVNAALAIIRMSGPEVLRAVRTLFTNHEKIEPRRAVFGSIHEQGNVVDDVILTFYRAPNSFTGEDMAEICCHGNPLIMHRIIQLLGACGVRLAGAGEFTRRAFLNGKMGLTEAEAINHVIAARSSWEIETAVQQMHGSLREAIQRVRERVIELKADLETGIDFIEENIEAVDRGEALRQVAEIQGELETLLRRCVTGGRLSRGIDVVIAGKPNVGKSSILNSILNEERAIVSDLPGTTRDLIRESVQIGGIHINLTDTAGIGVPGDEVEQKGIELTRKNIATAGIVLFVLDAATGFREEDARILESINGRNCIPVINKIDLFPRREFDDIAGSLPHPPVLFSAKTGEGFRDLENAIASFLRESFIPHESPFIADLRIINLLEQAGRDMETVRDCVARDEAIEITAFEAQSLLNTLAEITGEITPDDVLDSIFSRFCIGK